ncbi:MAG: hypothetical protein AB7E80_04675 [Hyphomicrobiaceae bacterium]
MNHPVLLGIGAALTVLGIVLMRWAGRYDPTGIAADAAWRLAKTRSATGARDEFGRIVDEHMKDIREDAARIGHARTAVKHGGRLFVARFVSMAGIILTLVGLALAAAAFLVG